MTALDDRCLFLHSFFFWQAPDSPDKTQPLWQPSRHWDSHVPLRFSIPLLPQPPFTSLLFSSTWLLPLPQPCPPDSEFQWTLCWIFFTRMRLNSALLMWILSLLLLFEIFLVWSILDRKFLHSFIHSFNNHWWCHYCLLSPGIHIAD